MSVMIELMPLVARPVASSSSALQTSLGERDPELAAVAAPVFDAKGKLLGALSLSGTSTRYSSLAYLRTLQICISTAVNEIESMFVVPRRNRSHEVALSGVFNRSSQHLQSWRCYGTTCGLDEEADWAGSDAVTGRTLASARGGAAVLGAD